MTEEINTLLKAFSRKEENERFLINLEKLKTEGSLEPDIYLSMKADYKQRLDESLQEIDRIKASLRKQIETLQREGDIYKNELIKVEARYKTGELSLDTYQDTVRSFRSKITKLEQNIEELGKHMSTSSSTDTGLSSKEEPAPTQKVFEDVNSSKSGTQVKLPRAKFLAIGGGILIIIIVCILLATLSAPGGTATSKELKIPLDIKNAANIGSLHLELTYDATLLNVISVDGGVMLGNAIFKYVNIPGKVVVGIVSSSGIKGDGPLVVITFLPIGKGDKTVPLALENIIVYDGSTLTRLPLSAMNGSYELKSGSFIPPQIVFNLPSK